MMCSNAKGLGRSLVEHLFDREYRLARSEASSVANSEYMRVDGKGFRTERGVHYDICGLSANAGQGFQRIAVGRHLASMIAH